jgi:hypothetical protein
MRGNLPVTIRQRTLTWTRIFHVQLRDCAEPSRVHATCRSTAGGVYRIKPPLHKTQMNYSIPPQSVQAFSAIKMLET